MPGRVNGGAGLARTCADRHSPSGDRREDGDQRVGDLLDLAGLERLRIDVDAVARSRQLNDRVAPRTVGPATRRA